MKRNILILLAVGVIATFAQLDIRRGGGGGGSGTTITNGNANQFVTDADGNLAIKSGALLTNINASAIGAGTLADARIPSAVARDAELTAAISALSSVYQPLDSDLTDLADGLLTVTKVPQSTGITNDGTGLTLSIAAGDNITLSTNAGVITITGEAGGEGGSGNDADAIHDNESGEIAALTEKVSLADDDLVIIEDSAASNAKKKAKYSSIKNGISRASLGLDTDDDVTFNSVTASVLNITTANITTLEISDPIDESALDPDIARDSELPATQSGSHASPSTTNPLAPTWTVAAHMVWYGATGEIDLPAASGYSGKVIGIYNTGAFTITIDPNGSEVIVREGTVQTGGVTMTLSSGAGNFVWLYCDGTRWITLGKNGDLAAGS